MPRRGAGLLFLFSTVAILLILSFAPAMSPTRLSNIGFARPSPSRVPADTPRSYHPTRPNARGGEPAGTTYPIVATIPVGTGPTGIVFDSGKGELFVADHSTNNVSVISDATNSVVATIPVGSDPQGMAYDPSTGDVFVTDFDSNAVSVISDSTDSVVATIAVGQQPVTAEFDSQKNEVFVGNTYDGWYGNGTGDGSVSVVDASDFAVVSTISLGNSPESIAYDPDQSELYVANFAENVSVISDSTDSVVAGVPMPLPSNLEAVIYDGSSGNIYVVDEWNGVVYVIPPANNTIAKTIPVGSEPTNLCLDPSSGDLFVSNFGTAVEVVSTANNTLFGSIPVSAAVGLAYDTDNGDLYVANLTGDDVAVASVGAAHETTYPVSFDESGLPAGTEWSVNVSGQSELSGTSATLSSALTNGSYKFAVVPVSGYNATPDGGEFQVSGSSVEESITFVRSSTSPPTQYSLTFTESGLANGTVWAVSLNGSEGRSSATTVTFAEPNGTYSYVVEPLSGFSSNPASGSVYVRGTDVQRTINFTTQAASPSGTASSFLGLPTLEGYAVVGAVVAVVAAASAAFLFRRTRGRRSVPPPAPPP